MVSKIFSRITMAVLPVAIVIAAGCSKKEPVTTGGGDQATTMQTGAAAGTKTASGGAGLFDANCAKCHPFGDKPGGRAPNLTHIGAEKDEAFLTAFIKDPKSKDPGSRMPAFGGKMSDGDIAELAKYLAAQK